MASFPNSVKSFTTKNSGDVIQPADVNDLQDEVNAIEAGLENGTARINSSASTMTSLSVTGGSTLATLQVSGNSTLASTITIGALPYIFPSAGGSVGATLQVGSTSGSTMTLSWGAAAAASPFTLLTAASGVSSAAVATDIATIAITGLTAKDSLYVIVTIGSVTQATAAPLLRNTTDGVTIISDGAAINAGTVHQWSVTIRQRQTSSTSVMAHGGGLLTDATDGVGGGIGDHWRTTASGFATAWTGNWTLALRHGGVTAGGTCDYSWAVYKLAGQ